MEGAMCGLPIMYINSGGIPEYCNRYGVETTKVLLNSLEEIKKNYSKIFESLQSYDYTFENASKEFLSIFENSLNNNHEIKKLRIESNRASVFFKYINNKIFLLIYSNLTKFKKILRKAKKSNILK